MDKTDLTVTDKIIDYAMPLMQIERMARRVHDLCLEHRYNEAREVTLNMSVETRVLQATLAILETKERRNADTKEVHDQ